MIDKGAALRRGRNRVAMEDCERVAAWCIQGQWGNALSAAFGILGYSEYGKIDMEIWYPLLIEALDLRRRRPATMHPWAAS